MQIDRWPASARGRSRVVVCSGLVWTVANVEGDRRGWGA